MVEAVEGGDGGLKLGCKTESAGVQGEEIGGGDILPRKTEHLFGGVDAGDPVAARGELPRQMSRSAAEIENGGARRNAGEEQPLQDRKRLAMESGAPVSVVEPGEAVVADLILHRRHRSSPIQKC